MFETILVRPIFNVLTLIYALVPGHNFGISIILFTILARFAMWPLVRKQLHHTKAIRALQPELKKIKKDAKGDRQKEAALTMALYKEREINPFGPIGLLIVQLPILLALYSGLHRIVVNPHAVVDFSYPFIRNLSWMKTVAADISRFDNTLVGVVDLTRKAYDGHWYIPGLIIVVLSAVTQYLTSKQLMVTDDKAKSLRQIMREASSGTNADQAEVSAATARMMRFIVPVMIFVISISLAAAISLYWFIGGLVAYIQQSIVLKQDVVELEASVDEKPVEAEIVSKPKKKVATKTSKNKKKRR